MKKRLFAIVTVIFLFAASINAMVIKPITNASGWHLLAGMGFDVFMDFIGGFFQLNKVITIWTWNNNSWSIWSPDENIMKLISNYGLKTLSIIYRNQGIWVNLK